MKDAAVAIDAPPDDDCEPAPEAAWTADAARSGLCGVVTPDVVACAGGYRMYYTQILPRPGFPAGANDYTHATSRILSAFSGDGTTWTPEPGVRLTARDGGAGESRVVCPDVVALPDGSDRLRMYFECCPGTQKEGATIRSAISSDGLSWRLESGHRLADGDYGAPRVLFSDDGSCRMYCSESGRGIVSAFSQDGGVTFVKEPGLRIARELPYEQATAYAPEVLRIDGGGFRMYYAGYSDATRAYVLTAVSDDGLAWSKHPEPAVAPGGPLDSAKCSEMCVMPLSGRGGESRGYRMFYEACDGTAVDQRGVWRILSATTAG